VSNPNPVLDNFDLCIGFDSCFVIFDCWLHCSDRYKSYFGILIVGETWKYMGVKMVHDHASLDLSDVYGLFCVWCGNF